MRKWFWLLVALAVLAPSRAPSGGAPVGLPAWGPMSSAQVIEGGTASAPEFQGVEYRARVAAEGLTFEADGAVFEVRATRLRQGRVLADCPGGPVERTGFGIARIDRGVLVEEYYFENRRAEQVFVIPEAIGEGAIVVGMEVRTNLGGKVTSAGRGQAGWSQTPLEKGGLIFHDRDGAPRIAYHTAVAFDARGRSVGLDPRYEDGEISLEVPEAFMAGATFPIVVDPWIELAMSAVGGGVSGGLGFSGMPSLVLDGLGNPMIAWAEETAGNLEIYLRRWNGAAWVELGGSATGGGISATAGDSMRPSLALDGAGNPVVAWGEDDEIYLKRWNGAAWVELGGSATGGGISATAGSSVWPSLALDASGNPVVAWWDDSAGNEEIYLKRWNGAAWVELAGSASGGGISANAGMSLDPSLALDGSGNPIVAWWDTTPIATFQIYVRRWNGAAWVELDGSATGGGVSFSSHTAISPSLAVDGVGRPVVAWENDNLGDEEIYLRRWNGQAWVELGQSASAGGTSGTPGTSRIPSLSLDGVGNPVLAWEDGGVEIYLKRWNGSAWVEMAGSATGGGISANLGWSRFPDLALDAGGNPVVAWGDNTPDPILGEVYLKRWTPVAGVRQLRSGGMILLPVGGSIDESSAVFRGIVSDNRLQVEVQPIGTPFTGVPSGESVLVPTGFEASLELEGLANGTYHWQARSVDFGGQASSWVSFGANAETEADFIVAVPAPPSPPAPPPPQTVVIEDNKGNCGATGMEAVLVLGALGLLRRGTRRRR